MLLRRCISKDPLFIDAYAALAEICYRSLNYDSVFYYTESALQLDTYHPAANYIAGLTYMEYGDMTNALESLGWAARSPLYRSAGYEKMAVVKFRMNDLNLAEHYALQSLIYNSNNLNSLQLLALVYRQTGQKDKTEQYLTKIESIDRLSHFAAYERYLMNPSAENQASFISSIDGEMPYQSFLELAIWYYKAGLPKEAAGILRMSQSHPLITIWQAYIAEDSSLLEKCVKMSPAFVFPFRQETVKALEWAADNNADWKFRYYLALNYAAIGQQEESKNLLSGCGIEPDYAPFYLTRAAMTKDEKLQLNDLLKARELAPSDWRTAVRLIGWYRSHNNFKSELSIASEYHKKQKENSTLGLEYAIALNDNGRYAESLKILDGMTILPTEGSSQGKRVFEQATVSLSAELLKSKKYSEALKMIERSKDWPENLGVGKPYNPDTRIQDYMELYCFEKLNRTDEAGELTRSFTVNDERQSPSFTNILVLKVLQKSGNQKEATTLLNDLKKSRNPMNQWVVAVAEKNKAAAEKIEKEFSSNQSFLMIKKVMEATGN
jgi:predicted Zn-dependent protease